MPICLSMVDTILKLGEFGRARLSNVSHKVVPYGFVFDQNV